MNPAQSKAILDGWLQVSGWISTLLISGIVLCGVVTVSRILGKDKIKIKDIELPLHYFWMVAVAFTLAHLFLTWSFVNTSRSLQKLPVEEQHLAWTRLTVGNNLLFNGMMPREEVLENVAGLKVRAYRMRWEPSTVLSLAFCALLFASVARRLRAGVVGWLDAFVLGFSFCAANWAFGSIWSVTASQFAP